MPPEEQANWEKLMYFMMAFIYERREESEHEEFLNIIKNSIDNNSQRKEAEEMGKTMSQVLQERGEAIGEARGIEKGIEKGTVVTKQEAIIRLLRLRFEFIPETLVKQIKSINEVSLLDEIFDRAVTLKAIEDLEIEE
jgi:predicted transposase YdaD